MAYADWHAFLGMLNAKQSEFECLFAEFLNLRIISCNNIMKNQQNNYNKSSALRHIKTEVAIDKIENQLALHQWRAQQASVISYQWIHIQPYSNTSVLLVLNPIQKLTNLTQINTKHLKNIHQTISIIFQAFKNLYEKFGPFEVFGDMIAFDTFYDVYVWINKQHIKNECKREHISQSSMISNILSMLKKYNVKYQRDSWLNDAQFKGNLVFTQICKHFHELHEKQRQIDNKKLGEHKILAFSCSNKLKRKKGQSKTKALTKTTSFNSLKSSQDSLKLTIPKPGSSIQLSSLKVNPEFLLLRPQNNQVQVPAKLQVIERKQEQLQISMQFGQSDQIEGHQCAPLLNLDSIKHFLVNSINFND